MAAARKSASFPAARAGGAAALVAIFLFIGSFLAAAQSRIEISIAPLVLELTAERGQSVPFSITILNRSQFQTARFRASAAGLQEGRSGEYTPVVPDEGPYAASSWVRFEETEFEVGPGSAFELRGVVEIPRNARPSGYAAAVIELLPEERVGPAALSVEYVQRFVVPLEIVVGRRHVRSANVDSMAVVPAASSPELAAAYGRGAVLFLAGVVNDGDVHVAARGTLILRDERGRRVREVPLGGGRGVILPDTTVDFGSVLVGLAPGKYEMQAVVHYGGPRPAVGRMEFELSDEEAGISRVVAGRAVRIDAAPAALVYEFPRGAYRMQTITVVNRDSEDVDVTVSLQELVNDADGQPVTPEPGVVMPYSAVPWGDVRPAEFTLRPGQRRNVVVGFRVPEGESGGRYARVRIEGRLPAPGPGMETAVSELTVDALLTVGADLRPVMEAAEVEWRTVGATGLVTVGVTVANEGNIHGEAGLRLTLQEYVPAQEEDMGDFIFVRDAHWLVVDAVETGSGESVLLPGEHRFLFGVFSHELERDKQYRALIEVLGAGGRRDDLATLFLWVDAEGNVHEGTAEHLMGADEA